MVTLTSTFCLKINSNTAVSAYLLSVRLLKRFVSDLSGDTQTAASVARDAGCTSDTVWIEKSYLHDMTQSHCIIKYDNVFDIKEFFGCVA